MTELISLLQSATSDERLLLAQILGCSDQEPPALALRLQKVSSSFFAWRIAQERLSYREIVTRVSERMEIGTSWRSTPDIERTITEKLWNSVWERMTVSQREQFNRKLIETAAQTERAANLKGVAIAGGGLLAAKASGFGIYLLASSTLAAVTSGLGFALPFGAYMTISSALSWVLGPVGFVGLGLLAIHKVTGPDHQKMTMATVAICAIRSRIAAERTQIRSSSVPWALIVGVIICLLGFVFIYGGRSNGVTRPVSFLAANSPAASPLAGKKSPVPEPQHTGIQFGNALVQIVEPGPMGTDQSAKLIIEQNGKPVQTLVSGRFSYSRGVCGKTEWPNPGDLDGDGKPELVIEDYSGGARCCFTWHIFQVRDSEVSRYLTIRASDSDSCPFVDLDGDGRPEVRVADPAFAHWRTSLADSPVGFLNYRLTAEGLAFAPELMRKDPPSREELDGWAREIRWNDHTVAEPLPAVNSRLVALIESGRARLIPEFLDLAWPQSVSGRAEYLQTFGKQLRTSDHWNEWDDLNGGIARIFEAAEGFRTMPDSRMPVKDIAR
jgi:uncharacterized protein YaaW (UPF0174 family)